MITNAEDWFAAIDRHSDAEFMPDGREQPAMPDGRGLSSIDITQSSEADLRP